MKYGVHTEISGDDKKKSPGKNKYKKMKDPEKVSDLDDAPLLDQLKKYTTYWYGYWSDFLDAAREHLKFLYVDQWDWEDRNSREANFIPTMQFNHVRTMIDSILGQQKKNSPQVIITSLNANQSTEQRAETDFRTDLYREIQYRSKADEKYQTCYRNQLICGWGFLRAEIHYETPNSFKKCLKLNTNADYQVAFWDPNATDATRSNGDFCGIYQRIAKDDFKRDYPHIPNPTSVGQEIMFIWETEDTVTVCDIYYKDYFKKTIVKLSDGQEMEYKEAKKIIDAQNEMKETMLEAMDETVLGEDGEEVLSMILPSLEIVEKRDVMDYTIKHARFVQNQIIDKTDWPGKLLPIVYVPGNPAVIDGRENPISFINDLQDPQRLHNYVISDIARGLVNTAKSKWIGTPQMTKGYEQAWRQPQKVQGMLLYNPDNRVPGGKPEAIDPPPFNASLLNLQSVTTQEMQVISGQFEESRGEESNAMSGVAIRERLSAANKVVNVYFDNLLMGIEQLARVSMELLPHIYEGESEVNARSEEGKPSKITVNKKSGRFLMPKQGEDMFAAMDSMQEEIENDLSDENYDIMVKAVGSLDTQKQKSLEFMLMMMQVLPQSGPLLGDLIVGESDIEGAGIAKERLKTLLPPQILSKEEGIPMPPPQPDPFMEMEKMRMQLMQMDMEIKASKVQQEQQKMQVDNILAVSEMKLKEREMDYKEEKAVMDANIDQMRAATELRKVQIQASQSRQA